MLLSDQSQGLCCDFQFLLIPSLLFAELQILLRGATAMRKLLYKSGVGISFVLFFPAVVLADTNENVLTTIFGQVQMYVFIAFVIIVIAGVAFMKSREDKRQTPLNRIFEEGKAIHSVGPDTPVTECVRLMTAGKIGALIVMDGERLVGIFTERDALNKVLAGSLDPSKTKVSAVMTKDPYSIPPTTTVGDAMKLITRRRFRHLPIVDNGKVLAVVSSGDLTHWLVQDQMGEVQELVDLAARS
jgi:CBS domain-containing protein